MMGEGKNSTVTLLLWNQANAASTVSGTATIKIGMEPMVYTTVTNTTTTTLDTTSIGGVMAMKVASLALLVFSILSQF